jgi:hypothetical protein
MPYYLVSSFVSYNRVFQLIYLFDLLTDRMLRGRSA